MREGMRMGRGRRVALMLAGLLAAIALPAGARAATIQATEVSSMQSLYGLACVSSSTCYAVGADQDDNPAVVTLTNGNPGAVADFSDPNFQPAGIACVSGGQCIVVGNDVDQDAGEEVGAVASFTNGSPGATQEVPSTSSLVAVGCTSYAYCIAAGQDQSDDFGTVEISGGQAATFTAISDPNFQGSAVACYSSNKCLVAGEDGLPPSSTGAFSLVTNGSPAATVSTTNSIQLSSVACTSTGSCAGAGNVNGGDDSSGYPVPDPSVNAISGGQFGAGWDYSQYSDGSMSSAACASATTCVAVGNDDNGDLFAAPVLNGNAGAAQLLQTTDAIGQIQLSDIACPLSGSCVAIGQDAYTNPVAAVVPVPAYQSQAPTSGASGGSGSGGGGSTGGGNPSHGGGAKKHKPAGRRTPTRLTLAVTWPHTGAVTALTITVRMQSAATMAGINGMRVRLEERAAGAKHRWRVVATGRTSKLGATKGEVRFRRPALAHTRVQYRAVFPASRRYAGAVSFVKTLVILS